MRSDVTFLKALHMTKDIPEVSSRRETPPRLLLHLPHPKIMPTSQGTLSPRLAQTMTTPHLRYSGQQGPLLSHLTDQEIEAGKWGVGVT